MSPTRKRAGEQDYIGHGSRTGLLPYSLRPHYADLQRRAVTLGDMMDNMDALLQEIT